VSGAAGHMVDDDAHEAIEELEERIESLGQAVARCRKISLAAKLAVAAGVIWILLVLLTIVSFDPATLITAMAMAIGGVVLLGSNATTWRQTEAELHSTEAERVSLIGRLHLSVVGEDTPTLH
jgi:hypothetical protein